MFGRILLLCLLSTTMASAQPAVQWAYDTRDNSFGQSAAADLDQDGKLEIVFGCYRNDSCVYALNAENGSLLWKFNAAGAAEGCNDAAPLLYDVDLDGRKDVIVAASCNPKTFCLDGSTGRIKWVANTRGSDSPPTVADLDGDGKPEILHGEFGGYVVCLHGADGSVAWELAVDTDSWIQTAPSIADLDGDGRPDFVVATWNAVNRNANKVYAFRGSDRHLLWAHALNDVVYHGTAVGDLDQDGIPELLIGCYNDTLYCLNGRTGATKWTYSVGNNFAATSPAIIADLDADGRCDVVFAAWYKMVALRGNGSQMWVFDMPGYAQCFRGPALADLNNDAYPDVVFGTDHGDLIALHGENGSLLFQKNLRSDYGDSLFSFDHAPLIADFNRDGKQDVFIVGGHGEYPDFYKDFGRAYMLTVGPGHGPDWLMFQHDVQRRSNACNDAPVSISEPLQQQYSSLSVIAATDSRMVQLQLAASRDCRAHLSVLNQWGQVVFEDENLSLHKGNNTVALPVSFLPAGLYLARVRMPDQALSTSFSLP